MIQPRLFKGRINSRLEVREPFMASTSAFIRRGSLPAMNGYGDKAIRPPSQPKHLPSPTAITTQYRIPPIVIPAKARIQKHGEPRRYSVPFLPYHHCRPHIPSSGLAIPRPP